MSNQGELLRIREAVKCLLGEVRIEGEGVPHGQAAHDEEGGSIHEDSHAADASAT